MLLESGALRFDATPEAFENASIELRKRLAQADVPRDAAYDVEVVFEEIVTNIVRHGRGGGGEPTVEVTLRFSADTVTLVFNDDGVPFNPCDQPEPDPFGDLGSIRLGGLGISLARKASSRMTYERTATHENRLTVAIRIGNPRSP